MATKKISEFTTLGSLSDSDILPVVSSGSNKKITAATLKTYAQGTGINYDAGNELSLPTNAYTEAVIKELNATALVLFAQSTGGNIKLLAGSTSAAGAKQWLFSGTTGNLTLPAGGDIKDSNGNSVLGGSSDRIVNGDYNIHIQTNGSLVLPSGDESDGFVGTLQSANESSLINLDVSTDSDVLGGIRLQTWTEKPIDITTWASGTDKKNWRFGPDGSLSFPQGSVISETATTTVIKPPTANIGQTLVIRPTGATTFGLTASGYIVPGQNLTITLTNINNASVDNTYINYTITNVIASQLGLTSLTGHFPYLSPNGTNPQSASIVLPIPLNSSALTFTLTIDGDQPAGSANVTITVTSNGIFNNELSHVHLVAGDPTTVDLYLGDDDQYVKIEKNGGAVVVGTNLDSNHWTFGTDGDLVLPAGKTIRDTEGVDLLNEATSTQYGWFNELSHSGDNNRVQGEAVAMDSDGNSYVSYSYYDDNANNDKGGVAKFSITGTKLWSVDIQSQNGDARYPEICSLEYTTINSNPVLIAFGSYYDDNAGKDVAIMYAINPETGAVGVPLFDVEITSDDGMELKDGVVGFDSGSNPFAVIVGDTYNQKLTKTLTPLAGSAVDKLYFSWSDVNASGLQNGDQLTYQVGGYYGFNMNAAETTAAPAGSTDPSWSGLSLIISSTQSGSYVITRVNGWGSAQYGWNVPQTLTVLGSNLGGVDGINDMTFDFDRTVFNDNSDNINAAVSNIQGTPISDVYCRPWNGKDWSTEIGNPLNFEYNLNNQAFIARLGNNPWSKSLGATNYDKINSVVVDSSGNTFIAGYVWNSSRASLAAKYDIDGNQQWAVYIDPSNNTGNELTSIDLLSSGDIITVDRDGTVTKLNKDDGAIIWQVTIDDNISWDSDFRGTATPNGDYIITNYEDDDYTMYVMRVSGADGSSVWTKRITRTYGGQNGEIYPQDDFDAQYIDCNDTYFTIGATTEPPNGDRTGLAFSLPINGENVDGTYGEYVVSSETMSWTIESTTSTTATLPETPTNVIVNSVSPTKSDSSIIVNQTTIGGGVVIPPPDRLVNGNYEVVLDSNGHLIFPDATVQTTAYTGDYNSLSNKPTYKVAVSTGTGPGGNNQADMLVLAGLNPTENIPSTYGGDLILKGGYGGFNNDLFGEVRIQSGQIGANFEWHFTVDRNIKLPVGGDIVDSTGATAFVSLATLKQVVAASTDFADFQSRIANM